MEPCIIRTDKSFPNMIQGKWLAANETQQLLSKANMQTNLHIKPLQEKTIWLQVHICYNFIESTSFLEVTTR